MNRYIPIAYHESYKLDLPKGHRFPMEKYKLLPNELINQGISKETDFFSPYPPELNCVTQVHDKEYVLKLKSLKLTKPEIRKIGFPLSKELIDREFLIAGGTVMGVDKALTYKISMNIAGGTHHSFSDRGEGFCLLNDQAIAAKYLLKNHAINKILIVDLDVHQGNGTASIFKSIEQVFTFSMHGDKNFPFKKEKSDLDIGLKDNTTDIEYLTILKKTLPLLIKKVRPNFIFYLSGVDVIKTDKLGRLSLTLEGCKDRDKFVFSLCKKENIPVQCSMGGGYSEDISVIVDAHLNTYKMAKEVYF